MTFESWIITMHAIIGMKNLYKLKELKDLRLFFLSFIHILFFLSLSLFIPLSVFSFLPLPRESSLIYLSQIEASFSCTVCVDLRPYSIYRAWVLETLVLETLVEYKNKWFTHFYFLLADHPHSLLLEREGRRDK